MMKIEVAVNVNGNKYRLKGSVKKAIRNTVLTAGIFATAVVGAVNVFEAKAIDASEVVYEQVFVDSPALIAIGEMNPEANAYDLLHLFEEKNNVENAAEITAGMYYIPVVAE